MYRPPFVLCCCPSPHLLISFVPPLKCHNFLFAFQRVFYSRALLEFFSLISVFTSTTRFFFFFFSHLSRQNQHLERLFTPKAFPPRMICSSKGQVLFFLISQTSPEGDQEGKELTALTNAGGSPAGFQIPQHAGHAQAKR